MLTFGVLLEGLTELSIHIVVLKAKIHGRDSGQILCYTPGKKRLSLEDPLGASSGSLLPGPTNPLTMKTQPQA